MCCPKYYIINGYAFNKLLMLTISGDDTTRPSGIWFTLFANDVCYTTYHILVNVNAMFNFYVTQVEPFYCQECILMNLELHTTLDVKGNPWGGHSPLYYVTTCIQRAFLWGLFTSSFGF